MKKFIVLDTETAPTADSPKDGNPHAECMNVYDLGWIVTDKAGNIYERRSLIISDTFFNDRLMQSAYYADKRPIYLDGIGTREWEVVSLHTAYDLFCDTVKRYGVREVWAYNANFDKKALNRTIQDCSEGWRKWFFPFTVKICDIWDFAGSTICDTNKYVKWCMENDHMSEKGNPSTSAETVYRYLTGTDFQEAHTALQDCEIELAILRAALKRKQKKPTTCGQGWRKASKRAKALQA